MKTAKGKPYPVCTECQPKKVPLKLSLLYNRKTGIKVICVGTTNIITIKP